MSAQFWSEGLTVNEFLNLKKALSQRWWNKTFILDKSNERKINIIYSNVQLIGNHFDML